MRQVRRIFRPLYSGSFRRGEHRTCTTGLDCGARRSHGMYVLEDRLVIEKQMAQNNVGRSVAVEMLGIEFEWDRVSRNDARPDSRAVIAAPECKTFYTAEDRRECKTFYSQCCHHCTSADSSAAGGRHHSNRCCNIRAGPTSPPVEYPFPCPSRAMGWTGQCRTVCLRSNLRNIVNRARLQDRDRSGGQMTIDTPRCVWIARLT